MRFWKLYWCFNKKCNLIVSICPGLEREGLKSVVRQAIFAGVYDMRRTRNWKVIWEKTKLCYLVLHPGNNKQNVPLALIVIHETTITATQSYFPNRRDVPDFSEIFNAWWTISNSNRRFSPNIFANAVINAGFYQNSF